MDGGSLLRMVGALSAVLGLLFLASWCVRRFGISLPGGVGPAPGRRLALSERVMLDSRRSVALIRRDGREHLILLSPEGSLVIESGIVRDSHDEAAEAQRRTQLEAERQQALEAIGRTQVRLSAAVRQAVEAGSATLNRLRGRHFHRLVMSSATRPATRTGAPKRARRKHGCR